MTLHVVYVLRFELALIALVFKAFIVFETYMLLQIKLCFGTKIDFKIKNKTLNYFGPISTYVWSQTSHLKALCVVCL